MFESPTHHFMIHSFQIFHFYSCSLFAERVLLTSKTIHPPEMSQQHTAAGVVPAAAVAKMKEDGPQRLFSEALRGLGHVWLKGWWFQIGLRHFKTKIKLPLLDPKPPTSKTTASPMLSYWALGISFQCRPHHPLTCFSFICDDTDDALHRFTEFIQRSLLIHTFDTFSIFGCCLWILVGMLETC